MTASFQRGPGPTVFLTENVAWVTFWSPIKQDVGPQTFVTMVYRTIDGGQTWRAGDSIPPEQLVPDAAQQLDFVDAQHGWLLAGVSDGPRSRGAAVYRTSDGGDHWSELFAGRRLGPPVAGRWSGFPVTCGGLWLHFVDPLTGWAGGDCGGLAEVFLTRDGGVLWQPYPLPPPAWVAGFCAPGCLPELAYAGRGEIALTVRYNDTFSGAAFDRPNSILYASHDAGQSWQVRRFPAGRLGQVIFLNARTGWAIVDQSVHATVDGGARWARTSSSPLGHGGGSFDFVNAATGWALGAATSGPPSLARTLAGGANWVSLSYGWVPVVAFSCRLPISPDPEQADHPHAGFISFPDGQLVDDPSGEFVVNGNLYTSIASPHLSGLSGPSFYNSSVARWLPATREAVLPDGSSYAYANSTDPAFPSSNTHSQLHVVTVESGADHVIDLPGLQPFLGWAIAQYDLRGVYLFQSRWEAEPTAERWLVNPMTERLEKVSDVPAPAEQPGNGWWSDVSPSDPDPVVSRYDGEPLPDRLVKQGNPPVVWFYQPGKVVQLLGIGPDAHPLVVVATGLSSEDHFELWLVRAPGAGRRLSTGPELFAFFGSQSSLTDRHGLWIGSGEGVFLYEPNGGFRRVAHLAGRLAGECR